MPQETLVLFFYNTSNHLNSKLVSFYNQMKQFYLKMKDEDVVIKFKEALKCDYPIRHDEIPYYNYTLQITPTPDLIFSKGYVNWGDGHITRLTQEDLSHTYVF